MQLTLEYLKSLVVKTEYAYSGLYTTCTITTKSGSKFTGESGVLDPAKYDKALGEKYALEDAIKQLWRPEGYFFQKLGLGDKPVDPSKVFIGANSGEDAVTVYY